MKFLREYNQVEDAAADKAVYDMEDFFNNIKAFFQSFDVSSNINPSTIGGTIPKRISLQRRGGTVMMVKINSVNRKEFNLAISWHGTNEKDATFRIDCTTKLLIALNFDIEKRTLILKNLKMLTDYSDIIFDRKDIPNINVNFYNQKLKEEQFDL